MITLQPIDQMSRGRAVVSNWRPYNKGLERTRRVGVPASRAVVGVPPCRSTQCSTTSSVC